MRPTALLLLLAVTPATSHAQFGMVEALFEQVNSVAFALQGGALAGSDQMQGDCGPVDMCGMSAEVFLNLRRTRGVLVELALGTTWLRGFSAKEPSIDLHGSLRSLPTAGLYLSRDSGSVTPFVGLQVGLSELWNVQAYDAAGTEYAIAGSTYDLGASTGLAIDDGPLDGFFVEASYRHRHFPSLDWDAEALGPGWPREIDLSGWFLSVGFQVDVDSGD